MGRVDRDREALGRSQGVLKVNLCKKKLEKDLEGFVGNFCVQFIPRPEKLRTSPPASVHG